MPILTSSPLPCSSTTRSRLLKQLNHLHQRMATIRLSHHTLNLLQTHSHQLRPPSPTTSLTSSRPLIQARSRSCLVPCRSRTTLLNTLKLRLSSMPISHASLRKYLAPARPPASAPLFNHSFQHLASNSTQHWLPCLEANLKPPPHLSSHQRNNLAAFQI